jgi:transposase-like protein
MSDFKWRHFRGEMILSCARWYCKYGISYRDLEEIMLERGLAGDHTTLYRWVQHYAPEMEKRLPWYWKPSMGYSSRSFKMAELLILGSQVYFPPLLIRKIVNDNVRYHSH